MRLAYVLKILSFVMLKNITPIKTFALLITKKGLQIFLINLSDRTLELVVYSYNLFRVKQNITMRTH